MAVVALDRPRDLVVCWAVLARLLWLLIALLPMSGCHRLLPFHAAAADAPATSSDRPPGLDVLAELGKPDVRGDVSRVFFDGRTEALQPDRGRSDRGLDRAASDRPRDGNTAVQAPVVCPPATGVPLLSGGSTTIVCTAPYQIANAVIVVPVASQSTGFALQVKYGITGFTLVGSIIGTNLTVRIHALAVGSLTPGTSVPVDIKNASLSTIVWVGGLIIGGVNQTSPFGTSAQNFGQSASWSLNELAEHPIERLGGRRRWGPTRTVNEPRGRRGVGPAYDGGPVPPWNIWSPQGTSSTSSSRKGSWKYAAPRSWVEISPSS